MADNTLRGSTFVTGALSCGSFNPPNESIGNPAVKSGAANNIDAEKVEQQRYLTYVQASNTDVATARIPLGLVVGVSGELVELKASTTNTICTGNATISIQIKLNGTNVLSSALVLDSTNTLRVAESTTGFTSTALVENDHLEADVTAAAGTGTLGDGLILTLVIREKPE